VLVYADAAVTDLARIREYIAQYSPERAAQKAAMIDRTCKLLDGRPMMGRPFLPPLRLFTKRPWLILYEPVETGVLIHRVFDSRQDWRSQISPDWPG